ncbi:MAG: preprotein translocase subunit SecG [Candidatus Aminicenantes bacterium]|nr:preprotein translocase subunit SecG [Candidatus Aminicenantes bacterium]
MTALLTAIHVIICIVLILAVLLQSGKAADLAGAFGGGGSATAFGPRGQASLMSKVTTISAVLFMVTSLGLWILSGHEGKSAVSGVQAPAQKTNEAPMTPAAKPPAVKTDANAAGAKTPADKPADKAAVKPPAAKAPAAPVTTTPSSGQPAPQPAPKK